MITIPKAFSVPVASCDQSYFYIMASQFLVLSLQLCALQQTVNFLPKINDPEKTPSKKTISPSPDHHRSSDHFVYFSEELSVFLSGANTWHQSSSFTKERLILSPSKLTQAMSSSERRYFENRFEDYDGRTSLQSPDGKIVEPYYPRIKDETLKWLKQCEEGFDRTRDDRDYSVYTGSGGMALLYMHLSETLFKDDETQRQEYLKNALKILEHSQHTLKGKRVTFVCGDPGILALLSVLYSKLGQEDKSVKCVSKLLGFSDAACSGDPSLPDEVLYGRAGFLFSLLFVQKNLGAEMIDHDIINKVCQTIIDSGEILSRRERSRSPLMYMWHEKHYVGAAHGIVGIIYMLLQALSTQSVQSNLRSVESCVEFLLSEQFSSGNFPSSLESSTDKLIHWCHGAPGVVHLMIKAYQVFGKEKYLNAAVKCGEVVWIRGLLKKGYGICHGVAGNAYTFLTLYKQTGDPKYLYRAVKFAEWCFGYGQHDCRTPDHPFSLFEGMAGTVYFLADMLEPKSSKFPAFEI